MLYSRDAIQEWSSTLLWILPIQTSAFKVRVVLRRTILFVIVSIQLLFHSHRLSEHILR